MRTDPLRWLYGELPGLVKRRNRWLYSPVAPYYTHDPASNLDTDEILGEESSSGQYIVGIQTAKLAQKISEQNLDFNELNTKEMVINSYYLVLITQASLDILEQNLDNLIETMEQTETLFKMGMAEQTDVDQISITVNLLENSRRALERNLELNYNLFRFQLAY